MPARRALYEIAAIARLTAEGRLKPLTEEQALEQIRALVIEEAGPDPEVRGERDQLAVLAYRGAPSPATHEWFEQHPAILDIARQMDEA